MRSHQVQRGDPILFGGIRQNFSVDVEFEMGFCKVSCFNRDKRECISGEWNSMSKGMG